MGGGEECAMIEDKNKTNAESNERGALRKKYKTVDELVSDAGA